MLILLSPAKSLDFDSPLLTKKCTQPRLTEHSAQLMERLKRLSAKQVGNLMGLSAKLAELNYERIQTYEPEFTRSNSRQAILAFTGDVYKGMELEQWGATEFATAQKQIRILSGLYGVLRPLDLIQPYRLEMGTKLKTARGKNLYEFWGDEITKVLNKDSKASGTNLVVNLASNEYFSSVQGDKVGGRLITPVFKDEKNGSYKIVSFYAKKARGMMADFIVRKKVTTTAGLKKFNTGGYRYHAEESTNDQLVFLRSEAALTK